ncbi:MAG: ABC transporter ATP-binding protein [Oscillospiraceae bacterium]|nr:ABC transporter ATP-binding protein [Oscillospiraceae bacterium]
MRNETIRPYIRQFYRGNWSLLTLAMIQTVLLTASNLMISWLIQQIIDLTTGANTGFTLVQLVLLTVAALILEVLAYLFAWASKPAFIAKGIGQYKEYVFNQLCRKGISAFSGENSSLYISAMSNDAASIETNYLSNIFVIADSIMVCLGALCLMFCYSPLLTLISIGLSVLPLLASIFTGEAAASAEKRVSDRNASYTTTLKDSLTGFSVIKSFRAEAQICRIFAQKVREVSAAQCARKKISILVNMLATLSGSIVQFGVFLIGAGLVLSGSALSAGTVLVFVQLLNFVIQPVSSIPRALAECASARALIQKAADALSENIREEGTAAKATLETGITVRELSFSYEPSKPILRQMDVTFEAGKSYAIVGASGSGKSTLLNLLMASDPGYSGSICFDDTELRTIRDDALYEMVSVIQQNVFIFNASIRDNITMFSSFPEEEVNRAIRLSGLSSLIEARREDYLCGENGSGLSGGEKQRISIARSLLRRSQVLLVDEATAALDAQTVFQVSDAILHLDGLTRIVVTHTLDAALLKQYDCILTLKNGRIEEQGLFDELMEQKGYFYSLYTVSQ